MYRQLTRVGTRRKPTPPPSVGRPRSHVMDLAELEAEYAKLTAGVQVLAPLPSIDAAVSVWKETSPSTAAHVDLRGLLDMPDEQPLAMGSPVKRKVGLNIAAPSDDAPMQLGASSPIVDTQLPERPPKFALPHNLTFVEWAPSR